MHNSLWPHPGHSTHSQVGGDNPNVEGQEFFYPSPGSGKRPFPNENYSKIIQNSQNFHSYPLSLILNFSNLDCKR